MRRRIVAIRCKNRDLIPELEASLAAVEHGARFVDPATLHSESALHALQARLWRGVRERTRVYVVPDTFSLTESTDDLPFK
ncbi:MAG TPA: hypothetical protein VM686_00430 [Polyangiaceae bacterium]|jgi:hypothetical protein|nr:hypothetical protein [Polyangiaceae bacterium]